MFPHFQRDDEDRERASSCATEIASRRKADCRGFSRADRGGLITEDSYVTRKDSAGADVF